MDVKTNPLPPDNKWKCFICFPSLLAGCVCIDSSRRGDGRLYHSYKPPPKKEKKRRYVAPPESVAGDSSDDDGASAS